MATESLIPGVFGAADGAIASLLIIAVTTPGSPFLGHQPNDLALVNARVFVKAEGPGKEIPFADDSAASARLVIGSGKGEQTFFVMTKARWSIVTANLPNAGFRSIPSSNRFIASGGV